MSQTDVEPACPVTVLQFVSGTLEVRLTPAGVELPDGGRWDKRSACHRFPAASYSDVVRSLRAADVDYDDRARSYPALDDGLRVHRTARDYQSEALTAWHGEGHGRGVVVLPTGAGKTHVAVMAIEAVRRATLVVAPTLDLVRQWYDVLRTSFGIEVGVVGGGEHDVKPLTVTTYDSAYIHMEHLGARFGLLVFDECHHLPSESYALAARFSLAPFRLGLTATPERTDGREAILEQLIGPIVYRREIRELSGDYLAAYETIHIEIELAPNERAEYDSEREIYRQFLRSNGIRMSSPRGWTEFIIRSSSSDSGRRAMQAYRRQRELAFAAPGKLDYLDHLLRVHHKDRMLIFTNDNATAYRVSRRFLIPTVTHQTKIKERSLVLERFASGQYGAVVTSKVLNEGVDVPDANVAVVLSGSGTVREHVQRLGRILRPKDGKRALLYEIVSADTTETGTSQRRRQHGAYRAP